MIRNRNPGQRKYTKYSTKANGTTSALLSKQSAETKANLSAKLLITARGDCDLPIWPSRVDGSKGCLLAHQVK